MECRISALSRVGGRERNEDACGYLQENDVVCCVLADGAGGHGGGDVASRVAVEAVLREFVARPEASVDTLAALLRGANDAVLQQQGSDPGLADMRSTLVVLVLDTQASCAVWGHVGDSRLYLLRHGATHFRTRDHSLVQSMVDGGLISAEEALTHSERNVLIASIGSQESFQPSVVERPFPVAEGDAFLLCSDGFWGLLDDAAVESALMETMSPEEWLDRMEQSISTQIREGSDNYSAVGVWCGDVESTTVQRTRGG
ncbi:MAG TPA: protein phosphatase 2C domain-containing protein [Noviherbaspirillum sp.]|nr:protein phosphatase 2C domain-containing protein [Noviherbaspirillum sp.]